MDLNKVLVLQVLDSGIIDTVDSLFRESRFDALLCVHVSSNVSVEFPVIRLPIERTTPEELGFSLSVAKYLLDNAIGQVVFLGQPWQAYCVTQLRSAGLLDLEVYILDSGVEEMGGSALCDYLAHKVNSAEATHISQDQSGFSISVILVHHNRSEMAKIAIDSICRQTIAPSELIIVDDCSSDKELLALQNYVDALSVAFPVRILKNEQNSGLGASRNHGVRETESEFVIFLDDDDAAHPQLIENLLKARTHVCAEVITIASVFGTSAPEGDLYCQAGADDKTIFYVGDEGIYYSLCFDHIGGQTTLINRQALLDCGGVHTKRNVGADDWELYIRMLGKGYKIFHLPMPLLWYRNTKNSMSSEVNSVFRAQRDKFILNAIADTKLAPSYQELCFLHFSQLSKVEGHSYSEAAGALIDRLETAGKSVSLYCANDISRSILSIARRRGSTLIDQVIDGSAAKQKKLLEGYAVGSPDMLGSEDKVVVCSDAYFADIRERLGRVGVAEIIHWRMPGGGSVASEVIAKDRVPGAFDNMRCFFAHVPKVAGTSISMALFGYQVGHVKLSKYAELAPDRFDAYFKFGFVRNPWDRAVSAFEFLKAGGINESDQLWANENIMPEETFSEFVKRKLTRDFILTQYHFHPQYIYLNCSGEVGDESIKADFVGRYERLTEDFSRVADLLRLDIELPRLNSSERKGYASYYDSESRDIIGRLYEEDVKIFYYQF